MLAFLAFTGLNAWLILGARLLPFVDLPNHLAAAAILRDFGDPGNRFRDFYALDLFPRPTTFHMLFCALRVFPTVEVANRVLYLAYVVMFPTTTLLLIRRLGGNPWFALLSFPLLFSFTVRWGFAGFTLGLAVTLLLLYQLLELPRGIGRGRAAVMAGTLVLGYFVHALCALFGVLLIAAFVIGFRTRAPRSSRIACALATVPTLLLTAAWIAHDLAFDRTSRFALHSTGGADPSTLAFLRQYYTHDFIWMFPQRVGAVAHDLYYLLPGPAGWVLGVAFSILIASFAVPRLFVRPFLTRDERRTSVLLFLGAATACTLLLPWKLPGEEYLYHRYSVLVLLGMVLLGSLDTRRLRPVWIAVFLLACGVHFGLTREYFREFQRGAAGFDAAFLDGDPQRVRLAGLVYEARNQRGLPVYAHFPNYFIVWNHGVATTSLVDYRFGELHRHEGPNALPRYNEFVGAYHDTDDRYTGFERILVRGEVPLAARPHLADYRVLRTRGPWRIYERIRAGATR